MRKEKVIVSRIENFPGELGTLRTDNLRLRRPRTQTVPAPRRSARTARRNGRHTNHTRCRQLQTWSSRWSWAFCRAPQPPANHRDRRCQGRSIESLLGPPRRWRQPSTLKLRLTVPWARRRAARPHSPPTVASGRNTRRSGRSPAGASRGRPAGAAARWCLYRAAPSRPPSCRSHTAAPARRDGTATTSETPRCGRPAACRAAPPAAGCRAGSAHR